MLSNLLELLGIALICGLSLIVFGVDNGIRVLAVLVLGAFATVFFVGFVRRSAEIHKNNKTLGALRSCNKEKVKLHAETLGIRITGSKASFSDEGIFKKSSLTRMAEFIGSLMFFVLLDWDEEKPEDCEDIYPPAFADVTKVLISHYGKGRILQAFIRIAGKRHEGYQLGRLARFLRYAVADIIDQERIKACALAAVQMWRKERAF